MRVPSTEVQRRRSTSVYGTGVYVSQDPFVYSGKGEDVTFSVTFHPLPYTLPTTLPSVDPDGVFQFSLWLFKEIFNCVLVWMVHWICKPRTFKLVLFTLVYMYGSEHVLYHQNKRYRFWIFTEFTGSCPFTYLFNTI